MRLKKNKIKYLVKNFVIDNKSHRIQENFTNKINYLILFNFNVLVYRVLTKLYLIKKYIFELSCSQIQIIDPFY